jgi:hypothetical protein
MKACFFAVNLVFGVLAAVLGVAALLNGSHSFAAIVIGVVTLGLGAICFCLCKGCVSHDPKHPA